MAETEAQLTERLLIDAGIRAGMRVVDVGCGRGEVSFLVSRLVGPTGEVVGVDRDAHWLGVAHGRIKEFGVSNVRFVVADLTRIEEGPFDAAVGRRVLMYQPDAVAAVRALARVVKPGGLVVFQEHDASMVPASSSALPLHRQVHEWIWRTVEREGANLRMGFELHRVFESAGLAVENVRAEALVQTPSAVRDTAGVIRAILPRIIAQGVATEAAIDVETLEARLRAELQASGGSYIGDMVFGAWARTASV